MKNRQTFSSFRQKSTNKQIVANKKEQVDTVREKLINFKGEQNVPSKS